MRIVRLSLFLLLWAIFFSPVFAEDLHLPTPPYRTITTGSLYSGTTAYMFDNLTSTHAQGYGSWTVNLTWNTDYQEISGVDLYIIGVDQGIVISDTNGTSFSYSLSANTWQNKSFNPPLKGRTITYKANGWTQTAELEFRYPNSPPEANFTITLTDTSTNNPTSWNWTATNLLGNNTECIFSSAKNPIFTFGIGNWRINLTASNGEGTGSTSQIMGYNLNSPIVYFWNRTA